MIYKSLLLDVDGTLVPVGPHTAPSAGVCAAIGSIKDRVHVSIVSGRPVEWLDELFEILDLSAPSIINGGTQIIDPKTREIIWERPLQAEDVAELVSAARQTNSSFLINDSGKEHKDPASLDFKKPLAMQISLADDEALQELMRVIAGMPSVAAHEFPSWTPGKTDVYVTHADATKRHAAEELSRILNIETSEMIGIGDGKNDIPLLSVCGLKVAMGNAHQHLKDVAHYVAPSVDEDGVAHVIERFILEKIELATDARR